MRNGLSESYLFESKSGHFVENEAEETEEYDQEKVIYNDKECG